MRKLITLALLSLVVIANAQIPKPLKHTYVNDFAHILSKAQIKELNKSIFRIEKKASVQFAIVLVNKLPAAYEIEDYSLLIARKWHVGKAKNGIVYVAVIKDHKQRLEVAKMMVDKLGEEKCAEILSSIKPYFRQEDYYGGLQSLVASVSKTIDPDIQKPATVAAIPQKADSSATAQHSAKPAEENAGMFWLGFGAIVLVIYIIYRLLTAASRRQNQGFQNFDNGGGYPNGNVNGPGGYYGGRPSGGGSRLGSFLGGAAVGAAGGYLAKAYQDRNKQQNNNNIPENLSSSNDENDENDDTNYGNWGSGNDSSASSYNNGSSDSSSNDSSGSDSSSSSDNSSNSGFSGDGATSNW